jgi:serine/threonine protein kinase
MEELAGRQFGPYRVVAPLGEGGMAAVYQAYQPSVDRFVALKVLSRYFTNDPQFLERFRREAKTVAQLQHPHILPVFDFGESDSYAFLVMPFVQGGTLAQLLNGSPVSMTVTARVIRQVCEALDYAHAKGIVHRDIKPSNILIDERGNCLVADFGLARIAEGATKLTQTGAVMGTPAYMSPEQADGKDVGPQSDIYSVGIVLYEMLTGRVPFEAETPIAVAIKHLTAPLPPPRILNPALIPEIEAVVLKALARSRSDRFSSAEALVASLTTALQSIRRVDDTMLLPPGDGATGAPSDLTNVMSSDAGVEIANEQPRSVAAEPTQSEPASRPGLGNERVGVEPVVSTHDPDFAKLNEVNRPSRVGYYAVGFGVVFLIALTAALWITDWPTVIGTSTKLSPPSRLASTRRDPKFAGVEWALIPAGSFVMGCTTGDTFCSENESPPHNVTLTRLFELMTTEVTSSTARALGGFLLAQPQWSRDDHPAVYLSWNDASKLCAALGGRLPTEAEWEYAARGGASASRHPWGFESPVNKALRPNGARFYNSGSTTEVRSFAANGYGLYDTSGNAFEWVTDWWGGYGTDEQTDPRGPSSGGWRVRRGGSWYSHPAYLRVSYREYMLDDARDIGSGVRCARDISP